MLKPGGYSSLLWTEALFNLLAIDHVCVIFKVFLTGLLEKNFS